MKKSEMIEQIAGQLEGVTSTKKMATIAFEAVVDIVATSIRKEGRSSIPGLGTFTVTKRGARTGRNPSTGEKLKIKASQNARFKPSPALKEAASKFKMPKAAKA